MKRRAIISVGVGRQYPKLIQRQALSLQPYKGIDHITWTQDYPTGSPTHDDVPYAFKSFALLHCLNQKYDTVLWLDSSVWAQHDPTCMFDIIEKYGYLIFKNGFNQANWSTDEQLNHFGYTRDEAEKMPHPIGGIFGVDLTTFPYQDWIFDYVHGYPYFRGSWTNANMEVSNDLRCLGSRHDQSYLGFLCHKYGLKMTLPTGFLSYDVTDENSILLLEG